MLDKLILCDPYQRFNKETFLPEVLDQLATPRQLDRVQPLRDKPSSTGYLDLGPIRYKADNRHQGLIIEFSPTKAALGNNVQNLTWDQIPEALDVLNRHLIHPLSESTRIYRYDLAYNLDLAPFTAAAFLPVILGHEMARWEEGTFGSSRYFQDRTNTLTLYDKLAEDRSSRKKASAKHSQPPQALHLASPSLLRCEYRRKKNAKHPFQKDEHGKTHMLRLPHLYDPQVQRALTDQWYTHFRGVQVLDDATTAFPIVQLFEGFPSLPVFKNRLIQFQNSQLPPGTVHLLHQMLNATPATTDKEKRRMRALRNELIKMTVQASETAPASMESFSSAYHTQLNAAHQTLIGSIQPMRLAA